MKLNHLICYYYLIPIFVGSAAKENEQHAGWHIECETPGILEIKLLQNIKKLHHSYLPLTMKMDIIQRDDVALWSCTDWCGPLGSEVSVLFLQLHGTNCSCPSAMLSPELKEIEQSRAGVELMTANINRMIKYLPRRMPKFVKGK